MAFRHSLRPPRRNLTTESPLPCARAQSRVGRVRSAGSFPAPAPAARAPPPAPYHQPAAARFQRVDPPSEASVLSAAETAVWSRHVVPAMAMDQVNALCEQLVKAVTVMMDPSSNQRYRLEALKVAGVPTPRGWPPFALWVPARGEPIPRSLGLPAPPSALCPRPSAQTLPGSSVAARRPSPHDPFGPRSAPVFSS